MAPALMAAHRASCLRLSTVRDRAHSACLSVHHVVAVSCRIPSSDRPGTVESANPNHRTVTVHSPAGPLPHHHHHRHCHHHLACWA